MTRSSFSTDAAGSSPVEMSGEPVTPDGELGRSRIALRIVHALRICLDRWWLFPLFIGVCAAIGFFVSRSEPSRYTATATLLYAPEQADRSFALSQSLPIQPSLTGQDRQNGLQTVTSLVTSPEIRGAAEKRLGAIPGDVSVNASVDVDTNLISFSVVAASPEVAARIANGWAKAFVAARRVYEQRNYLNAIQFLQGEIQGPAATRRVPLATLQRDLQTVRVGASLVQSDVQLAQPAAVPTSRSSPTVLRDTVIAGFVGLLLALLTIGLAEGLDRRLKTPEAAEAAWDRPLLATIPSATPSATAREFFSDPALVDAFRNLQTVLRFASVDRHLRVICVTSASAGEGKTVVSLGLAQALAWSGRRVLLIDADMRAPATTAAVGLHGHPGLSNVLINDVSLGEAVTTLGSWAEASGAATNGAAQPASTMGGTLHVLGVGPRPPDTLEMLSSHRMDQLLGEETADYDYVVVDTAPVVGVSDTFPLIGLSDGVVIAARIYHSRSDLVRRASELISRAHGPVVGIAVAVPKRMFGGYYGSYYGYGYSDGDSQLRQKLFRGKKNGQQSDHPSDVTSGLPS